MVSKKWQKKLQMQQNGRIKQKRGVFYVSFKLKVLEEAKIPHEMVRKKRGESRGNSAHASFKPAIPN